jgi:hypothetical protein
VEQNRRPGNESTPQHTPDFSQIEREGTLPNSFYEPVLSSFPNQTRTHTHTQRERQANVINEYRCKNPQ